MRNSIIPVFVFLSVVLFSSCNSHVVYSDYRPIPLRGWEADSVLTFEINIQDTLSEHDILLHVRHTDAYPYQNMWLFLDTPTGSDTIEFYLADQRGRWLGNGFGNIKEMPVLYGQSVVFPHSGVYRYTIRQGMREETLPGVHDIGLTVERK